MQPCKTGDQPYSDASPNGECSLIQPKENKEESHNFANSDHTESNPSIILECRRRYMPSVWPDLEKFRHFGKFLMVYLWFGKMISQLCQICDIIGLIFSVANDQILKYNWTIWSHCICTLYLEKHAKWISILFHQQKSYIHFLLIFLLHLGTTLQGFGSFILSFFLSFFHLSIILYLIYRSIVLSSIVLLFFNLSIYRSIVLSSIYRSIVL